MSKRRFKGIALSKLNRIDRKCDRLLSELIIIRHSLANRQIDDVLENLHASAVRMRAECERERERLSAKYPGC